MEGISLLTYKGKNIYYIDYSSVVESKEKVLQILNAIAEEYIAKKVPPKSVLELVNVANLTFDSDIIYAFKKSRDKSAPFEKKVAVIGMKGLQKVAYNFIMNLNQKDLVKAVDQEEEAKEWLIS